ncbi:TIGR04104 family putative zinc finger protein [Virgibacillus ainsalahensis]
MPACTHCKKQWSYLETLKNLFRISMICPYCNKENYYDAKGGKYSVFTFLLAPLIIIVGVTLDIPMNWIIFLAVILLFIHFLTFPFRTRLRKGDL